MNNERNYEKVWITSIDKCLIMPSIFIRYSTYSDRVFHWKIICLFFFSKTISKHFARSFFKDSKSIFTRTALHSPKKMAIVSLRNPSVDFVPAIIRGHIKKNQPVTFSKMFLFFLNTEKYSLITRGKFFFLTFLENSSNIFEEY